MDLRDCCEKSPAQPRSAVRGKALVVDECPEDLKYCSTLLESYGYQVRGCCSYCEGVKCLDDQGFDFVIVSQGTPKFPGSSVLKRVIELDRNLPVLVVARSLDMESYLEAMQLGARDYLVEPLTAWDIAPLLPL